MNKKAKTAFLSWLGKTELKDQEKGGIAKAIRLKGFDEVYLFGNLGEGDTYTNDNFNSFGESLKQIGSSKILIYPCKLKSPTDLTGIYNEVHQVISKLKKSNPDIKLYYHMNSGTAPMIATWMILAQTKYHGELLETHFPDNHESKELVKNVEVPFELTAEFISDINHQVTQKIASDAYATEFQRIIHKCKKMREVVENAKLLAMYDVNVLIEGESGTGKELFARAIHDASKRNKTGGKFVAFNCGAFPENLVESHLFGYVKGAFSGANENRKGLFHEADGGTLFLDEVAEAPKKVQVELLRAIQEGKITRVGATKEESVDVRVIAAINSDVKNQIRKDEFREDLYYRLAVGTIYLPPLRQREGDLTLIIEEKFKSISKELNILEKKISADGKNFLLNYSWPGNVRELENALKRALIWSDSDRISLDSVKKAVSPMQHKKSNILNRPIKDGFKLKKLLDEVRNHYIKKALKLTNGNESEAGKLLGFDSGGKLVKYHLKKSYQSSSSA